MSLKTGDVTDIWMKEIGVSFFIFYCFILINCVFSFLHIKLYLVIRNWFRKIILKNYEMKKKSYTCTFQPLWILLQMDFWLFLVALSEKRQIIIKDIMSWKKFAGQNKQSLFGRTVIFSFSFGMSRVVCLQVVYLAVLFTSGQTDSQNSHNQNEDVTGY